MSDSDSPLISPDDDSSDSTPISFEHALEVLEKGTIDAEHGVIRWSSNYTFLTTVVHEDDALLAVYKPQRGERPLWDFPDGTLCFRERASFVTSEMLGWRVVPPTVLREGPRGLGSVQFFIDHDPEYHYFEFDESFVPQLMRLALFDYLINNADRKGGHCIVDGEDHLWGIDHGIAFHASHKLRTVIWDFAGEAIPTDLLDDVERLKARLHDEADPGRVELAELLSPRELQAFIRRVLRTLECKTFPLPGPGPNQPWPPV